MILVQLRELYARRDLNDFDVRTKVTELGEQEFSFTLRCSGNAVTQADLSMEPIWN